MHHGRWEGSDVAVTDMRKRATHRPCTYTTGPLVVDPFAHVTPYHVHGCVDDIQPLLGVQYGPPVDK